jgi:hypothetical protein
VARTGPRSSTASAVRPITALYKQVQRSRAPRGQLAVMSP